MSSSEPIAALPCTHSFRWAKTIERPLVTTNAIWVGLGPIIAGMLRYDVFYCSRCCARAEQGTPDPVTVSAAPAAVRPPPTPPPAAEEGGPPPAAPPA